MGIDAMITIAIIECLQHHMDATLEELAKYASLSVDKTVGKKDIRRAVARNRHRLEVELDAGIIKVSLKF